MEAVRVVADCREERSGVVEALRCMPGVSLEVRQLRAGDYQVENQLVVERKRLLDFAVSLADGRLFAQAARLSSDGARAALLLEGQGRELIGCEVRREAMLGAIVSLSLIWDLPVLRTTNPEESARLLVYAGNQLRRREQDVVLRYGRRPKRSDRMRLWILQGLPGVGPKKARLLLEHFGSVSAVARASLEELRRVEGLGEHTAEGIRRALD